MRKLLIAAIICMCSMNACGILNEAVSDSQTVFSETLNGYVKTNIEGCDVAIEIMINDKKELLRPINLNPLFYKDGMHLRFKYRILYEKPSKGCNIKKIVELDEETTPLRS